MGVRTSTFLSAVVLAAASTTFTIAANAQEDPVVFRPRESVPETVDNAFYSRSESMTQENDSFRSIQSFLGTFQFPENAILSDGKRIHNLYKYLIERQVGDDPVVRTADLASPFNFSVQTLPSGTATRLNGSEFVV
ncbi:MAG: hypothetical protein HC805_08055 [Alkalinema sp. RL_2_19]|nr:hypothetical protein [Alkalinema sp. RL_2_19]